MSHARLLQIALVVLLATFALESHAWIRSPATRFATLPAGTAHPEGITADSHGNIYVANFDVSKAAGPGNVVVFNRAGKLLRKLDVDNSTPFLLGIAFHPSGSLLVVDFGAGKVLDVNPDTGTSSVFTTLPSKSGGTPGPNALAFDASGNVYVSDSAQGVVWRTGPGGGVAVEWAASDLLLPKDGFPPFGANGLAFNSAGTALLVANTAQDTVISIPVDQSGNAGTPAIFAQSINGADGLLVDTQDNIWVAANQSDEIVVLDPSGRVIAKLGDFGGIDGHGSPIGLLFPASLVISNGFLYVTNLSLQLDSAIDAQWAAAVTHHTIARIRAHIPPVRGD